MPRGADLGVGGARERLLWRMLYETAARAREILLLNVGDVNVANKAAMAIGKGGNAEPIGWETDTVRLLPRSSRAQRRAIVHLQPGEGAQQPAEQPTANSNPGASSVREAGAQQPTGTPTADSNPGSGRR